ncbi:OB-fold nucleic acid binding domain-containing protein [Ruania zhangjianzhongii]|uniref:OB-fold nucleic acid binding domain-containing protein n=1 Tax=Ruania zhangjianzhongii TaxID=2603206 RepID=UPI0011C80904|nr:OB-fold nucleic acid binding domain-containing protein [Ruania zhangjianzhongii]
MSLRQVLRSVLASRTELDAGTEQQESLKHGAQPVSGCRVRQRVDVAGLVRSVTFPPAGAAPELIAELYDGTGSIDLVWLGRREIPGIEPGRRMSVTGTLCAPEPGRSRPVVYNPGYRLFAASEAPPRSSQGAQ